MRAGAGRSAGWIGAGYFLVEGGSGRDLASRYVRHCHILEHENNDMVGTYEVLKQEVTGMARTFSIDTVASPSRLLERARRAASENGVTLVGDEGSGRFSHKMLRGEYRRTRTNGGRHHNLQAPIGALVRTGGPAERFVR